MKMIAIILMLLVALVGQSQILSKRNYVVLTFERKLNIDDNSLTYLWLVPIDITENFCEKFVAYPLVYNNFCSIKHINDTTNWERDSDTPDSLQLNELSKFNDIVKKHRTLIQTFQTKWHKYQLKETVKVYMTPVTGTFIPFAGINRFLIYGTDYSFSGQVYTPVSDFSFNSKFDEATDAYKLIAYANYSSFDFSSFISWGNEYYLDRKRVEPITDERNDISCNTLNLPQLYMPALADSSDSNCYVLLPNLSVIKEYN